MNTEWLENLNVGDEVYVSGRYGGVGQIRKVVRLTKTQILISEHERFRRNSGTEVGDGWGRRHISPVTEAHRKRIYEHQLRTTLTKRLERAVKYAPVPVLEKLEVVVKEYENEQTAVE